MVLKIRLARFGKRNAPFYNIVVAQARFVSHVFPSPALPIQHHEGPLFIACLIYQYL